jgi:hypothetical protein
MRDTHSNKIWVIRLDIIARGGERGNEIVIRTNRASKPAVQNGSKFRVMSAEGNGLRERNIFSKNISLLYNLPNCRYSYGFETSLRFHSLFIYLHGI